MGEKNELGLQQVVGTDARVALIQRELINLEIRLLTEHCNGQ